MLIARKINASFTKKTLVQILEMLVIIFFTGKHGACGRDLQQEENANNLQSHG